jgi:hypothetical protein
MNKPRFLSIIYWVSCVVFFIVLNVVFIYVTIMTLLQKRYVFLIISGALVYATTQIIIHLWKCGYSLYFEQMRKNRRDEIKVEEPF